MTKSRFLLVGLASAAALACQGLPMLAAEPATPEPLNPQLAGNIAPTHDPVLIRGGPLLRVLDRRPLYRGQHLARSRHLDGRWLAALEIARLGARGGAWRRGNLGARHLAREWRISPVLFGQHLRIEPPGDRPRHQPDAGSDAMRRSKRPVSLHIFEHGGHGFGINRPMSEAVSAWPELFLAFAREHALY